MKTGFFRVLKHIAVLVIGSALLGTLLLTLVYCMPTGRIKRHVAASYDELIDNWKAANDPGFTGYLYRNKESFTDSIMVQYAFEKIPGKNAYEHAIWAYHHDFSDEALWRSEESLGAILAGADASQMNLREYSRYWHGYLVYLKPLLGLFTWKQLLIVGAVLQIALLIAVCAAAVAKNHPAVAAAVLMGCFFMKPALMTASLTMAVCWVITLAALLVMLLGRDKLEEKHLYPEFFAVVGLCTSYFDFLTYPVATLGFPLCAYFLMKNSDRIRENLRDLIGYGCSWCAGYAGLWAFKWIIAELTLRTGTIRNAVWTVIGITSGVSGNGLVARVYGGFHAIGLNFREYDFARYPAVGIFLELSVLAALVRAIVHKVPARRILGIALPYLLVMAIPFGWIMAAQYHSALHARFTFRILGVAGMAACGLALSLWRTVSWEKEDYRYFLFYLLLILYPLRRVYLGIDLWDGGYNYANFRYPGTDYMDPMWYFATWIATDVGAVIMRLPFGQTMLAQNLYTGLIVGLLAGAGFWFGTRKLKLPTWIAVLGEITACSLCWAPTSVLYNYLTFLFLTVGLILLYLGLTQDRERYLVAAGVMLGLNVGVRFSNLVQMGLILAVWMYCLWNRKEWKGWKPLWRRTLLCVAGYAGALAVCLLVIGIRYGLGAYFGGVARLFRMTEVADDYTPAYMLKSAFQAYIDSSYWIKRFGLALVAGTGICLVAPGKALREKKILCGGITIALFGWLLTHRFYYPDFATYEAIYDPCVMLLLFCLALSFLFLVRRNTAKEDRLVALLEILAILLTSLGGNNAMYYNINNMFLIMPFALYLLWKLWKEKEGMLLFAFKTIMSALVLVVCVLAFRFGNTFSYEEATGVRDPNYMITEIPVLKGMRSNGKKTAELTGLYFYLTGNELQGRECILYGQIPGIAYYMELTPAFNVWGELRSYTPDVMAADLDKVRGRMAQGQTEPVVILETKWADYLQGTGDADAIWDATAIRKAELVADFMEENSYFERFRNEKYVVYEKN